MSDKPTNQPTENAKSADGQCNTMSGTTSAPSVPHPEFQASKNQAIDPCSSLGHKSFEKK